MTRKKLQSPMLDTRAVSLCGTDDSKGGHVSRLTHIPPRPIGPPVAGRVLVTARADARRHESRYRRQRWTPVKMAVNASSGFTLPTVSCVHRSVILRFSWRANSGENPSNLDECVRICVDYVISIVSVLHLENAMNYRQWRSRRGNGLQSVLARCLGLTGLGPCALHPPCVL